MIIKTAVSKILLQQDLHMYRYLIFVICLSSLLNASTPLHKKSLNRKTLEITAQKEPISVIHTLLTDSTCMKIAYQDQNQLFLLACLPNDLQTYTLKQNFF